MMNVGMMNDELVISLLHHSSFRTHHSFHCCCCSCCWLSDMSRGLICRSLWLGTWSERYFSAASSAGTLIKYFAMNLHVDCLSCFAAIDPLIGRDVAIVPADRDFHEIRADDAVVGRIETDPADRWK